MQIAESLSKPQSYISKYERGERRLDFPEFVELAEILGIEVVSFVKNYQAARASSKVQKIRQPKKLLRGS